MPSNRWQHFAGYEAFSRLSETGQAEEYSLVVVIEGDQRKKTYLVTEDGKLEYVAANSRMQKFDPKNILSLEDAPQGWDIRFPQPARCVRTPRSAPAPAARRR